MRLSSYVGLYYVYCMLTYYVLHDHLFLDVCFQTPMVFTLLIMVMKEICLAVLHALLRSKRVGSIEHVLRQPVSIAFSNNQCLIYKYLERKRNEGKEIEQWKKITTIDR